MSLRSMPNASAGSERFRDSQTKSQNSAADAVCHEQEDAVAEDADERRKRMGTLLAQTEQRTRNDMLLKDTKKATKRQKALGENVYFGTIQKLEVVWHLATARRFSKWQNSERGIVGSLLQRFDATVAEEEVAAAFQFAVRYEALLIPHLVGPKQQVSLSLAFLHRHAETWFMLSKQWRKYQVIWDKVEAWRATHPSEYAVMPYELELAFDEARLAFGVVTGFKI